jgi:predicted secreted protein
MSQPLLCTLELLDCPGFNLSGDEDAAILMHDDPTSPYQQWTVTSIFEPGEGLAGFMIVNMATGTALRFMSPDKPLGMGPAQPSADVMWQLTAPDNGVLWHITAYVDPGQAVDAVGSDGCRDGAVIQSHKSGQSNPRQLWRIRP